MYNDTYVFHCPICDVMSTFRTEAYQDKDDLLYINRRCDNCKSIVFFTEQGKRQSKGNYKLIDYYPKKSYKIHQAIPKEIAADYNEARRCYDNSAFTASVVMCRRAIERTAIMKGGQGKNLYQKINSIIPEDLKDLVHEIRQWGNIGAHDMITNVKKEDADTILDFAEKMFWYLFIMPSEIQRSKNKRLAN